MKSVFLTGAVRTPIGRFGGSLQSWTAADLGTAVAKESLRRAHVQPDQIDDSIWGCARQAGGGPNVARQITFRAEVPDKIPAFTVNQACGSGLRAIILAAQQIMLGRANIVLAGGTESMSRVPYIAEGARWGTRMGHAEIVDGMYRDGFNDPLSGLVMGETAEELAVESGIDRAASDAWAVASQNRCEKARAAGRFDPEITPVKVRGKKGDLEVTKDEHPRDGVALPSLTKLAPVFREGGTVTAGNASGITDGAASILV